MSPELKMKLYRGFKIALIAFLVAVIVNFCFHSMPYREFRDRQKDVIAFSGYGEVTAVPDIANVYFTISKDSKTVKDAQALVVQVEKESIDFLKENNISEKDIKTSNASFYPKYEYQYDTKAVLPCTDYGCPPRPGKSVITGYTASESITVKVRNTDDIGKIMQGLGVLGVTDLNGPNFSIDDEEGLKMEARTKAINDAKNKAAILAKDLGIRLGKITSFSESGNYPMPMYAKAISAEDSSVGSAPAQIPAGENTVSSDVTITYEIK